MPSPVSATLVALTLNERQGVEAVLPLIDRGWFERIIVVDGGSTDGTVEWCRSHGFEVYVQRVPGIRHAYLEILDRLSTDVVVTISPDGNCPPDAIPLLLNKIAEGYDLVIGSRYLDGASSLDDDAATAFGNWLFTRTVNILHGARYTDCMVIFRAFRRSVIADLHLDRDESYRTVERLFGTVISWEPLMSVRAAKRKLRVAELPVSEPRRIGGQRKLQIVRWGAAYYCQFVHELWHWK